MNAMKKILSFLLVAILVFTTCSTGILSVAAKNQIPDGYEISNSDTIDVESIDGEVFGHLGDPDLSGKVDIKDVTNIQKYLAKLVEFDDVAELLSDVDYSDSINIKDATNIQKWLVNLETGCDINRLIYKPAPEPEPTTVPETTVPETTVPETTVPETTVPEPTEPETTVPETTVPETTVPETTVPETEPVATVDESIYTRGQWIMMISEKMNIVADELTEDYLYFYGDSINSEYGAIAETFNRLGLLPYPDSEGYEDPEQDIPLFEADKILTREYAAVVIARVMGYSGNYDVDIADIEELTYLDEVSVMIHQKYLLLDENGEFNPQDAFEGTDKNRVFMKIDELSASLVIDESEYMEEIEYQQDVVELEDTGYSANLNDDGTYTVYADKNEELAQVGVGDVVVFPSSEEYVGGLALKIEEVIDDGDIYVYDCIVPEMEEVVDSFEFVGNGTADIGGMTVADGVVASYDPNGVIAATDDSAILPFVIDHSEPLPGKLTYEFKKLELEGTGIELKGNLEFSIPDITARVLGDISFFGGLSIDEILVTVTSKFKVEGSLEYDFGIPESGFDIETGDPTFGTGKTELGRIPIKLGATGLSLDFVLFLNFEVSGKITVGYAITNTNGFQYKDGAFRLINDYSSEFSTLELNASAKVGLGIAIRLSLFSVFDLVGVDAHAGLGFDVKFTPHLDVDPDLYCGDATLYLYATFEFDKDTLVFGLLDDLCGVSWSYEIFNADSSPVKANLHIENLKRVDKCSYSTSKGHILGLVKDAETNEPIPGARVNVYNEFGNKVRVASTQFVDLVLSEGQLYKGEFLINNLPVGKYKLSVLATGYKAYDINIEVVADQRVVCEAALMLIRADMNNSGTVSGLIIDALTGGDLNGTEYRVRKNWNSTEDEPIMSGELESAEYSIELEPGHYTIEISKPGYVTSYANVVIQSDFETARNITLTPYEGINLGDSSFRAVLTWGIYPYDIDSHMFGYDEFGNVIFHTCYYDDYYYEDGEMIANLDVDDTESEGPETSTVYKITDDCVKFSFYVHDYSNRYYEDCKEMSNSPVKVTLYAGQTKIAEFNMPENREGTTWHAFDYYADTDSVVFMNEFSNLDLSYESYY